MENRFNIVSGIFWENKYSITKIFPSIKLNNSSYYFNTPEAKNLLIGVAYEKIAKELVRKTYSYTTPLTITIVKLSTSFGKLTNKNETTIRLKLSGDTIKLLYNDIVIFSGVGEVINPEEYVMKIINETTEQKKNRSIIR